MKKIFLILTIVLVSCSIQKENCEKKVKECCAKKELK